MSPRTLATLLFAAFFLLSPAAAQKPAVDDTGSYQSDSRGERIISYVSDITVAADASLHVTETIRVEAEGQDIRHGIYRDFPTRYQRNGRDVRVGFDVEDVQLDGQPVHYARESLSNGVRIRIGDADSVVSQGEHSYVIRYTTTRQLGFFADYDELYWNAIGTDWMFPIDRAEVRVHLPRPVAFGQRAFYTGPQGSTAADAEIVSESPGEIVIHTTRPLAPGEGLTISVTWPKNVVRQSEGTAS